MNNLSSILKQIKNNSKKNYSKSVYCSNCDALVETQKACLYCGEDHGYLMLDEKELNMIRYEDITDYKIEKLFDRTVVY